MSVYFESVTPPSFILIFLKLCRCFVYGMKICIWFRNYCLIICSQFSPDTVFGITMLYLQLLFKFFIDSVFVKIIYITYTCLHALMYDFVSAHTRKIYIVTVSKNMDYSCRLLVCLPGVS